MESKGIASAAILIICLFFAGASFARPLPELAIDSTLYNYGEVFRGKKISHAFILKNRGKGDLIIEKALPD